MDSIEEWRCPFWTNIPTPSFDQWESLRHVLLPPRTPGRTELSLSLAVIVPWPTLHGLPSHSVSLCILSPMFPRINAQITFVSGSAYWQPQIETVLMIPLWGCAGKKQRLIQNKFSLIIFIVCASISSSIIERHWTPHLSLLGFILFSS